MSGIEQHLPYYAEGEIIKGFGRGSKELGFPTANFPESVIDKLPAEFVGGIYWGLASVDSKEVHGMVMSIGWNPFYNNEKRAMETHILHDYNQDLYGKYLKVIILGHLRNEQNFSSLQELKDAIGNDISVAKAKMQEEQWSSYKSDKFFA